MERVETLIKKLQDQFAQQASADQMLLTVQMLQAELLHLQQHTPVFQQQSIAVTVSNQLAPTPVETAAKNEVAEPVAEEEINEVLQVEEAEI